MRASRSPKPSRLTRRVRSTYKVKTLDKHTESRLPIGAIGQQVCDDWGRIVNERKRAVSLAKNHGPVR